MTADTISSATSPRPALFSLRGRLGRVEFIAYSVSCALAATLLLSALGYFLLLFPLGLARAWYSLATVVVIHLLLPLLVATLAVKRLHDIGKPGWLALLLLVPMANFLFVLMLWAWPGVAGANACGAAPAPASTPVLATAVALPLLLVAGFLSRGPLGGAPQRPPAPSTAQVSPAVPSPDSLRSYRQ